MAGFRSRQSCDTRLPTAEVRGQGNTSRGGSPHLRLPGHPEWAPVRKKDEVDGAQGFSLVPPYRRCTDKNVYNACKWKMTRGSEGHRDN